MRRRPPQLPVNRRSGLGVKRAQLLNRRDGDRHDVLSRLRLTQPLAAGGAGRAAIPLAPPATHRAAVPRLRSCWHCRHLPCALPPHRHRHRHRPHVAGPGQTRHGHHTDACTWECHHAALLAGGRLQRQRRVRRGARRGLGVGGLAGGGGGLHRVRRQLLRPLRRQVCVQLWPLLRRPGLAALHCRADGLLRPLGGLLGGERPTSAAHDARWAPSCLQPWCVLRSFGRLGGRCKSSSSSSFSRRRRPQLPWAPLAASDARCRLPPPVRPPPAQPLRRGLLRAVRPAAAAAASSNPCSPTPPVIAVTTVIVMVVLILISIPLRLLLFLGPRPCCLLRTLPLARLLGEVAFLLALLSRAPLCCPTTTTAAQQRCRPAATARLLVKLLRPATSSVYSRFWAESQRLPWSATRSAAHTTAANRAVA